MIVHASSLEIRGLLHPNLESKLSLNVIKKLLYFGFGYDKYFLFFIFPNSGDIESFITIKDYKWLFFDAHNLLIAFLKSLRVLLLNTK